MSIRVWLTAIVLLASTDLTAQPPRGVSLQPWTDALEAVNGHPSMGGPPALAGLPDSLRDLFQNDFPPLLWEDADDEFRSPEWQGSVQQAEETIARRMVEALPHNPRKRIWTDGLSVTGSFLAWPSGVRAGGLDAWLKLGRTRTRTETSQTNAVRIAFGNGSTRDCSQIERLLAGTADPLAGFYLRSALVPSKP